MSVTVIRSEDELPPCGNCGGQLRCEQPALIYIFDRFDEIGTEIKTGEINLATCHTCAYRGWIWSGLLVIDRSRGRAVFVSGRGFSSRQEEFLDERLAAARDFLDGDTFEAVKANLVRVQDYRHIYEILCHDDQLYRIEVAASKAVIDRASIADVDQRASQLLEDTFRIGAFLLADEERQSGFISALTRALRYKLSQTDLPPNDAELCARISRHLESTFAPVATLEDEVTDELRPAGVDPLELTEEQLRSRFFTNDTPELMAALRQAAANVQEELAGPVGTFEEPQGIKEYVTLLRALCTPAGAASPDEIEMLAEQAAALAPEATITFGEEAFLVAEAIRQGVAGRVELLCGASVVACHYGRHGEDNGFSLSLARLLAVMQRGDARDLHVIRFLGFTLCGLFFAEADKLKLALGTFATAALSLFPQHGRVLRYPNALLSLDAITWQNLGRLLDLFGDSERAIMCAQISARLFETAGRTDGMFTSQLDALGFAIGLYSSDGLITEARALLDKIRKMNGERSGQYVDSEIGCLCKLGEALLNCSEGRPNILVIEAHPKDEAEEQTGTPALTDEQQAEAPIDDRMKDILEKSNSGMVLITRLMSKDHPPLTVRVRYADIEWLDCFIEAAELAARHRHRDVWFHIQAQVIERVQDFGEPDIPIYFYRLMCHRAEELGFGLPPEKVTKTLLLILAGSLNKTAPCDMQLFLSSPEVTWALDQWATESDAPDRTDSPLREGSRLSNAQGIYVGEIYEAVGRYDDAKRIYLRGVSDTEERLLAATDPGYIDNLSGLRTTGLYRAARAGLKHFLNEPKPERLRECLDMIECYKSRSVLKQPLKPQHDVNGVTRTSRFFRIGLDEMREVAPKSTALLVFALLPQSALNEGFWFSALLDTSANEVLHPRFLRLEEVHDTVRDANVTLSELRKKIEGATLDSACAKTQRHGDGIDAALELLGDMLIPPEVAAELEQRKITRLVIVPEAYIFDAPFPALRIKGQGGRVHLFRLNEELGGLAISVTPNWTMLAVTDGRRESPIQPDHLTLAMAARPTWRRVTPLFGVARRVQDALNAAARRFSGPGGGHAPPVTIGAARVSDFLRMLRRSRIGIFFGHGEIEPNLGSILIADDGPVGEYEVVAGEKISPFLCQLLILCACSGVDSQYDIGWSRRDLAGAHIAMLRGGVRYIIGSVEPLFPVVAVELLETILRGVQEGRDLDYAIRQTYVLLSQHPKISSPVFWGHIVGFGNGFYQLAGDDEHGN